MKIFDEVIIALGKNSNKTRYVEMEIMVDKISSLFENTPNVSVATFQGLTANFAKESNAKFILRGLRNTTDFEYENSIAMANNHLYPELETVFLITNPALAHISSTIIRDIHKYGGDVSEFLPYSL